MDEKLKQARIYVLQSVAYHEQCGETPDYDKIMNDAANLFGDTYDEYMTLRNALEGTI